MISFRKIRIATLMAGFVAAMSMVAIDHADARRGGSFGSRGTRTFQMPRTTNTAPNQTAPVERSMTPNTQRPAAPAATPGMQQRPGFFNGFGGNLLRGLALGGLIGLLLGHGFGGLAGMFGFLLQILLVVGAVMLIARFMRSRSGAPAMAGNAYGRDASYRGPASPMPQPNARQNASFSIPSIGSRGASPTAPTNPDEIGVTAKDLDAFEQMLKDVQDAYTREDYAALRRLTTPEVMSYLSEELAQNASEGVRNEVSDVRLLQGDVAESWREGGRDYATTAMRYESRDVTRDRASGRIVSGDADRPTEATELWTFTRERNGPWKLSAIQEA